MKNFKFFFGVIAVLVVVGLFVLYIFGFFTPRFAAAVGGSGAGNGIAAVARVKQVGVVDKSVVEKAVLAVTEEGIVVEKHLVGVVS